MAVNNLNTGVGIQPTIVDAKGDLIAATANDAVNRLAVGTNGHVLVADSGETTGLKWNNPGSVGGLVHINTTSFSAVASQSFDDVFSSTFENYRVLLDVVGSTSMDVFCRLRTSGTDNSSATYNTRRAILQATYGGSHSATSSSFHFTVGRETNKSAVSFDFFKPQLATQTSAFGQSYEPGGLIDLNGLTFTNTTQFDGFTLLPNTGNITGQIRIYGYAN